MKDPIITASVLPTPGASSGQTNPPEKAVLERRAIGKAGAEEWSHVQRFPWAPACAVIAIFLCLVAALLALKYADETPTTKLPWIYLSPNVILSASAIVTNALLRYVVTEGSALTWWYTALGGATLNDLHWAWEFKSIVGVLSGAFKGRFSRLALASVAVTIVAVHGIFFQRAVKPSASSQATLPLDRASINIRIADKLPLAWTGTLDGETADGSDLHFLTKNFSELVKATTFGRPIDLSEEEQAVAGCPDDGSCVMILQAVGLNWTATVDRYEYLKPNLDIPEFTRIFTNGSSFNSTDAAVGFYVKFMSAPKGTTDHLMTLDILYKNETGCGGNGVHKHLIFVPATVSYLVSVDKVNLNSNGERKGGTLRATLWSDSRMNPYAYKQAELLDDASLTGDDDAEIKFLRSNGQEWQLPKPIEDFATDPRTYGGILPALNNLYVSFARFRPDPQIGEDVYDTFGLLGQQYYIGELTDGSRVQHSCDATWQDPTYEIISTINELMFRSALAAARSNSASYSEITVLAAKIEYVPVWEIEWHFAIIAAVIPALGILFVLPTFWGFWRLERKFTGSPLEIAEAFDTKREFFDKNAWMKVDELLEAVGQKKVRYRRTDEGIWVVEKM